MHKPNSFDIVKHAPIVRLSRPALHLLVVSVVISLLSILSEWPEVSIPVDLQRNIQGLMY